MNLLATLLSAIGRRLRMRGVHRVIAMAFPIGFNSRRYAEGVATRQDGLLMRIDTRNHIDWQIYFTGGFEPHVSCLISQVLGAGDVAVDVGANIGTHALEMAQAVGRGGQVFAFEPSPAVRAALAENVRLNGFESVVTVLDKAVGETPGSAVLRVPLEGDKHFSNQGLASLSAFDAPHREVPVEVVCLDDFLEEGRVALVKIDVQGYDAKVVRGMARCLARCHPVVVFEYEAWAWEQSGETLDSLLAWLTSQGYAAHELTLAAGRLALRPLQEGAAPGGHGDIVAVHANSAWPRR